MFSILNEGLGILLVKTMWDFKEDLETGPKNKIN